MSQNQPDQAQDVHSRQQSESQQLQQHPQQSMRTRVEQCGNQILRVRGDSDSDMEALFSVLQNKNNALALSSLKNRKLPASFFRPPEPKPCLHGHDCTDGGGVDCATLCQGLVHPRTISTSNTYSSVISHCRSVSSPVKLLHSRCMSPRHNRQSSMDGCTDEFLSSHQATWDTAVKCPKYHMKRWSQDIHNSYVPLVDISQHQALNHQQQQHNICPNHSRQSVNISKHQDLGPLPHGWEQGLTPEGEIYFINHIEKTTSWYDPRLSCHIHGMTPVTICPALQPLEQQVPQFSQQQPDYLSQQQQQQQLLPSNLTMPSSARRPLANDQYLCLQLRKLQQEKERLQQEQEAIACREMMLNELVRHSVSSASGDGQLKCMSSSCALNSGQGHQSSCTTGLDPFLGQVAPGTVESHVRQNSTDSGLGGMGTTYSLPRSPDDYLSNVEEVDANYKLPLPHNSCYGNSSMNLDMTSISEMTDILEGDHLITSLGDELESELFNEMDVQKINNLLWL